MSEETEDMALTISEQLDVCMQTLPVRLESLVDAAKTNPFGFLTDNVLNRIIVILLNEQDDRISDKVCTCKFSFDLSSLNLDSKLNWTVSRS